jgi:hypothetical protein
VKSPKIEPAEQAAAKTEKKKPIEKHLAKQLHLGSAPLHWFKLTAGKRHPSRLRRAPAIYSVARLSQLRCALEEVVVLNAAGSGSPNCSLFEVRSAHCPMSHTIRFGAFWRKQWTRS